MVKTSSKINHCSTTVEYTKTRTYEDINNFTYRDNLKIQK